MKMFTAMPIILSLQRRQGWLCTLTFKPHTAAGTLNWLPLIRSLSLPSRDRSPFEIYWKAGSWKVSGPHPPNPLRNALCFFFCPAPGIAQLPDAARSPRKGEARHVSGVRSLDLRAVIWRLDFQRSRLSCRVWGMITSSTLFVNF
ncbi:hypothetical protein B0J12DRAFT_53724 [Macrophomina phaseolina]|uniref:Uncharacterized protein n=1 Tax=Macrophomina phaseolina TaxID=35725 RepID=A0ABQ8GEH6_9PEZI|nr:hypothetical protein B0J12DRAFT_53724 [Macrophomina phaseolina]